MSNKPVNVRNVTHCKQYLCLNNTGACCYEGGICKIEKSDVIEFENGTWGCSDEKYQLSEVNK